MLDGKLIERISKELIEDWCEKKGKKLTEKELACIIKDVNKWLTLEASGCIAYAVWENEEDEGYEY